MSIRHSSNALEAAIDYVLMIGCSRDEITILGVDRVGWRGATFTAVPVPSEPEPPVWPREQDS